ncbi:MAG: beta-N-acetylhexosaminidase [Bacteroidales bacterium]|nr:beta-N-acetylhexosaminidase [Bacteroidales bacterium]
MFLTNFLFSSLAALTILLTDIPVIPRPAAYSARGKGSITLEKGCSYTLEGQAPGKEAFSEYLEECELALRKSSRPVIRFKTGPKFLNGRKADDGAYTLEVGRKGITVLSAGYTGAFYAVQTLLQLRASSPDIPFCTIEDAPRFAHRGLMFDMVRHFHGKDFILKQLDLMALLKMNVLHLHITDDQAWRIELDCAPEMAHEAAFGDSLYFHTMLPRFSQKFFHEPVNYVSGTVYDRGGVYGGYYSKDDIKEIIAYAAARHIDIIPEIEIPGHNRALLHVHPEFFCDRKHGVDNVFCVGNEDAFSFFFKVLDEVMELFPSQYVHIGGDEARKSNWTVCSRCRERMRKEGLKDEFELQSYCIRRIDSFIVSRGKKLIGWDEILEGGISENATVMSWRGTSGGLKSIQMGHDVIMTPNTRYYLDYYQDAPWKEPLAFSSCLTLKTVYDYEPEAEISENTDHLLGVQGNLWSECIVDDSQYEYMLYPRAFAIAETGWSPREGKDYEDFRSRALSLCVTASAGGYKCFDLSHEAGERPEAGVQIPRITNEARAVVYTGSDDSTGREAPFLVDGFLGGWNLKADSVWLYTRQRNVTIDIDLGEVKTVHYVGAEFADFNIRRLCAPQDTEFFLSADGVNYEKTAVPQLHLSPDRRHFNILTVGGTVSAKARYVRLRYNTGDTIVRSHISEVIVN